MSGPPSGREPDRRLAAGLVAAQLLLVGVLALPARGRRRVTAGVGHALTALALLGLARSARDLGESLTPSPVPPEGARLHSDGGYAWVRHPIYGFLLLGALGRVLVTGPGRAWAAALLAGLLTGKARWEESMLTERFPEYADYAARTPRFVPRVRPVLRRAGRAPRAGI